jgi:hypothetical protein
MDIIQPAPAEPGNRFSAPGAAGRDGGHEEQESRFPHLGPAFLMRGRYWDRTSDLFGVNEALSR